METGIRFFGIPDKTIVVADEHPVFVQGVASILRSLPNARVSGQTTFLTSLLDMVLDQKPDLVVMGHKLLIDGKDSSGHVPVAEISRLSKSSRLMVFTPQPSEPLRGRLVRAGAYLVQSKDCDIRTLIRGVAAALQVPRSKVLVTDGFEFSGVAHLSTAEKRVLDLYLAGMNITEIASRLERSRKTISAQKVSAMRKLGVSSNQELIRLANNFPASMTPA